MHPISWLRPLTVNCFICDPPDLAAMHAEIRQFARTEIRQLADRTAVSAIVCNPPHGRVDRRAQVFAKDVHGRAAHLDRMWHFHILSDIFVFVSVIVWFALC